MKAISQCLTGSLCLSGEMSRDAIHHRDTEVSQRHRGSTLLRGGLTLLLLLAFSLACFAQTETKRNGRPQSSSGDAKAASSKEASSTRYTWEFSQPEFVVNHIWLEHDALGNGKVSFTRKGGDEPVIEKLELSSSTLERIQKLWLELRFLDSTENYQSAKNFAHLGTYKLGMANGDRQRTTEFNWSNHDSAWPLAQEYRRVADQAIFVFDITVARENQPLNTPGLLNYLESMVSRNGFSDLKQLVPLLKELRTDEHIPLIARNHAERLLKKIEK